MHNVTLLRLIANRCRHGATNRHPTTLANATQRHLELQSASRCKYGGDYIISCFCIKSIILSCPHNHRNLLNRRGDARPIRRGLLLIGHEKTCWWSHDDGQPANTRTNQFEAALWDIVVSSLSSPTNCYFFDICCRSISPCSA